MPALHKGIQAPIKEMNLQPGPRHRVLKRAEFVEAMSLSAAREKFGQTLGLSFCWALLLPTSESL